MVGSCVCFAGHAQVAGRRWLQLRELRGKDIQPLGCRTLGAEPEANNEQKGTALRFA